MVRVEITKSLFEEVEKNFKRDASKVFDLMESLESNPKKGKFIGNVGQIAIKELKFNSFRFYFLVDGYKLKFLDESALVDLLMRFVRMSDKNHQQEVINDIKIVLQAIGPSGFK